MEIIYTIGSLLLAALAFLFALMERGRTKEIQNSISEMTEYLARLELYQRDIGPYIDARMLPHGQFLIENVCRLYIYVLWLAGESEEQIKKNIIIQSYNALLYKPVDIEKEFL